MDKVVQVSFSVVTFVVLAACTWMLGGYAARVGKSIIQDCTTWNEENLTKA